MITQQRLKELLRYNQRSGLFHWLVNRRGPVKAGDLAGTEKSGYLYIKIDGVDYLAHRLAWLYVTGSVPIETDHRDTNGTNNRWGNLREATSSQNNANRPMHKRNTSGIKGVTRSRGKWQAQIGVNGRTLFLGRFKSKKTAGVAYRDAAKRHYGEFARAA